MDYPETPHAVAIFLLCLILQMSGAEAGSNKPPREQILQLYADCLRVAAGEDVSHGGALH